MDTQLSTRTRLSVLPVFIALIFNVLFGPLTPLIAPAIAADDGILDYSQCVIGDGAGLDCVEWDNGILNDTHNDYAEDQVVPQRLVVGFGGALAGSTHSVTITYMTRKDSSASNHAYDYLATWNETYANADRCQEIEDICPAGTASFLNMMSDTTVVPPGGPQPTSAHELLVRQFELYGGTLTGATAPVHDVAPGATGSDFATVTVTFTIAADDGIVQLLFGGHLAAGFGERGWGGGLGAGGISGGPYHIQVVAVDGASIGQRDNQIMSGAIEPIPQPALTIEKNPDEGEAGNDVTAGDYAQFSIVVSNGGPGVATNVHLDDLLPSRPTGVATGTPLVWELVSTTGGTCSVVANDLNCDLASLAAAASFTVTVRALTDADDCGQLDNIASTFATGQATINNAGEIDVLCGDIDVEKEPDAGDPGSEVTAGDAATFTLRTTNTGLGSATGVKLTDTLPVAQNGWTISTNWSAVEATDCDITGAAAAVQTLTCGGETGITLAAGAFIDVVVTTTADGVGMFTDCKGFTNPDASVSSSNDGSDTDAGEIDVLCGDIDVEKEPDAGDPGSVVTAGDFGTFTITVDNDGAAEARGVTLFDDLPETTNGWDIVVAETTLSNCAISSADHPDLGDIGEWLSCGPDDILPGAANALKVTVRTLAAADDCGLDNTAVLLNTADVETTNDGLDSDNGQITIECPDVVVTKAASSLAVLAPGSLAYTIAGANSGTGEARDVVIEDNLDDDLVITSATFDVDPNSAGGTGDCTWTTTGDKNQVECEIGTLGASDGNTTGAEPDTARVTINVTVPTAACPFVNNRASIESSNESSSASEDNLSNQVTVAVNCPDVSVDKSVSSPIVVVGSNATFTITASGGTRGTTSDVTLTDTVPTGFTWTVGGANIGSCKVGATTLAAGSTVTGGQTIACNFGPLGANQTRAITVSATPAAASCAATITNTASVAADGDTDTTNNSDTALFTVRCPTLVIDKVASTETITISGPNDALVATPSVVTWTLSYTLTNGPVTGAVITDQVPVGFTFLDAANGGTFANGTVTWNLGTLSASGSVTFRTTVNPATISRTGPTLNTAVIDSNETAPDNGQDSVTVTVTPPVLAGNPTPTPAPLPNTATGFGPDGTPVSVPIELLVAFFIGSLGALTLASARTRSRRR